MNIFNTKRWTVAVILLSAWMGVSGCGRGGAREITGTVTGKATLDGKPVAEGCVVVCQHVKRGLSAGGKIESDGTFRILMQDGPSIVAGDYKVQIQPPDFKMNHQEAMKKLVAKTLPKMDDTVVPKKYRSYETSKLFMIVKEGTNTFDIPMVSK